MERRLTNNLNTEDKVIEILKSIYIQNKNLLESYSDSYKDESHFKFYEAYWTNNLRLKNIIDLLEVIKNK